MSARSGWWKRRWLKRARRVEYHFLPETSTWGVHAACGEFVGAKKPADGPRPWTATPSAVTREHACAACLRALEEA